MALHLATRALRFGHRRHTAHRLWDQALALAVSGITDPHAHAGARGCRPIPGGPLVFQGGYHPRKTTFKKHPKHVFFEV